jgi:hypothetical protein
MWGGSREKSATTQKIFGNFAEKFGCFYINIAGRLVEFLQTWLCRIFGGDDISFLPETGAITEKAKISAAPPSKTYGVDFSAGKISGIIDDLAAMKQAISLAVLCPRFRHEIFSFNYGGSLGNLIGKPRDFVEAELPRLVTDALSADDRVISVGEFSFSWDKEVCAAEFVVATIFGEIKSEVKINV